MTIHTRFHRERMIYLQHIVRGDIAMAALALHLRHGMFCVTKENKIRQLVQPL